MPKQNEQSTELHQPGWGFLARAFWMMIGNAILIFSAISIFQRKSGAWAWGVADVVFWGTVVAIAIVRYLDIRIWKGLTAMGTPATKTDLKKHWFMLGIFSTVLWALAHLLNYTYTHK
jgi:hypothetical protein